MRQAESELQEMQRARRVAKAMQRQLVHGARKGKRTPQRVKHPARVLKRSTARFKVAHELADLLLFNIASGCKATQQQQQQQEQG